MWSKEDVHECFEREEHQKVFGDSLQREKKCIKHWLHIMYFILFFVVRAEYLRERNMNTNYFLIFLVTKKSYVARKQQCISWSPDNMRTAESSSPSVLLFGMHHEKKSPPLLLFLYTYTYTYWYFGDFFRKPKIQALHKRCQTMVAEMTVTLIWNYYPHPHQIQW